MSYYRQKTLALLNLDYSPQQEVVRRSKGTVSHTKLGGELDYILLGDNL